MTKDKVKRKTFVAREDFMKRISEIAKRKGYSLYDTVNEIFGLTIKAEDSGVSLSKAIEERELLKKAKEVGFILGLETLWYDMADLAYKKSKRKTLKRWFEAGVWLAKRYATRDAENSFEVFRKDLETFTWNIPEFVIESAEGTVSVRVISPRFSESYTVLFEAFLEGALKTFGYKIENREVARGNIRLKAVRKEADEQG